MTVLPHDHEVLEEEEAWTAVVVLEGLEHFNPALHCGMSLQLPGRVSVLLVCYSYNMLI